MLVCIIYGFQFNTNQFTCELRVIKMYNKFINTILIKVLTFHFKQFISLLMCTRVKVRSPSIFCYCMCSHACSSWTVYRHHLKVSAYDYNFSRSTRPVGCFIRNVKHNYIFNKPCLIIYVH